jgi:hypothetical protein
MNMKKIQGCQCIVLTLFFLDFYEKQAFLQVCLQTCDGWLAGRLAVAATSIPAI